jgi:hypothetical protein
MLSHSGRPDYDFEPVRFSIRSLALATQAILASWIGSLSRCLGSRLHDVIGLLAADPRVRRQGTELGLGSRPAD